MINLYNKIADFFTNISSDKYLHCIVSIIIAFVLTLCFNWIFGIAATMFIGLFKEYVIDLWIRKTKADWGDILADVIGTLMGTIMAVL